MDFLKALVKTNITNINLSGTSNIAEVFPEARLTAAAGLIG